MLCRCTGCSQRCLAYTRLRMVESRELDPKFQPVFSPRTTIGGLEELGPPRPLPASNNPTSKLLWNAKESTMLDLIPVEQFVDRQDGAHLTGLPDVSINKIGPFRWLPPVKQDLGGPRGRQPSSRLGAEPFGTTWGKLESQVHGDTVDGSTTRGHVIEDFSEHVGA